MWLMFQKYWFCIAFEKIRMKIEMESPKKMTSDKKILLETIKVQTFQYLHQTIEIALLFRNILIIQQSMV